MKENPMIYFTNFLVLTLGAIVVAVISIVYILIMPDQEILNWWFRFGERFKKNYYYLWKPVWGCELCFSGELALWWYLYNVIIRKHPYDLIHHIYIISASILLTRIMGQFFQENDTVLSDEEKSEIIKKGK